MIAAALAVGLLAIVVMAHRLLGDLCPSPPDVAGEGRRHSVSVVTPARNEAAALPTLLRSLGRQTTPVTEVVVVDDGSQDATAYVARMAGAVVLTVDGPPPGWTGKAWACHRGARATNGDLLLFLDADTELAPEALERLLSLHDRQGGLVSVQPFHVVVRLYEQLSSYFNLVSLLASGAFGPHPERRAMAFGPCLLTSRADYDLAGGHTVVRSEILDDVRLAAAYRRAGLPVRCAVGGASIRMRMYPGGMRQLVEGWTKNFASGASAAAPGPTLVAVLWVAAHHAVAVGAVLAAVTAVTGWDVPWASGGVVAWGLAWLVVAGQLRWVLRRIGSFHWWTWALFPAALVAFDAIFVRSVLLTSFRHSVQWRGRDVRLTEADGARDRTPDKAAAGEV